MAKKRVLVLFGGSSEDYGVSLKSAYSVIRGIDKSKYDVIPVGITKAGRWLYYPGDCERIPGGGWENDSDCCSAVLSPDPHHGGLIKLLDDDSHSLQKIDAIFPVLGGKYGGSGQVHALCKMSGIAYVGSGFAAANACFDRILTHLVLNEAGIRTARYCRAERVDIDSLEERFAEIEAHLGCPIFVKPSCAPDSVKSVCANNRGELKAAVKTAFSHHHRIIIEEAVFGRELECAVWGSVYALNVSAAAEIFDDSKASEVSEIPAEIGAEVAGQVRELAKTAFLALGCKNFAKITFRLTENGLYCHKVSSNPDLDERGTLARLMAESGYEYSEMLNLFIEAAKEA